MGTISNGRTCVLTSSDITVRALYRMVEHVFLLEVILQNGHYIEWQKCVLTSSGITVRALYRMVKHVFLLQVI